METFLLTLSVGGIRTFRAIVKETCVVTSKAEVIQKRCQYVFQSDIGELYDTS